MLKTQKSSALKTLFHIFFFTQSYPKLIILWDLFLVEYLMTPPTPPKKERERLWKTTASISFYNQRDWEELG